MHNFSSPTSQEECLVDAAPFFKNLNSRGITFYVMAPKSMELNITSCRDLKDFNFFKKLTVYATVSIVSPSDGKNKKPERYQLQKTPVDKKGDGNPEWNHPVQFDFKDFPSSDIDTLFFYFDLLCDALFGDKTIGQVRIPIKKILDDSTGGAVRFLSYQVVTTCGKPNGVLNFSYKVIDDRAGSVYYPVVDMPSNEPLVYTPPVTPPPQGIYPPLPDVTYYPPSPSLYPASPTPYGAAFGDYNYNFQACSYHPLPDVTYYPPPPPSASVYPPPPMEPRSRATITIVKRQFPSCP